jgi:hypothetical protein
MKRFDRHGYTDNRILHFEIMVAILGVVIFLLWLLPASCRAADNWTTLDTKLEITWQVTNLLDLGTSLNISNRPDKYHEAFIAALFISKHPSREQTYIYFGVGAGAHYVVSRLLPTSGHFLWVPNWRWNPRRSWQFVTIGASGGCVVNNFSIGLTLDF